MAVATAQALFDAMAAGEVPAARELFTPGATLTRMDADTGGVAPLTSPASEWLDGLPEEPGVLIERMFDPVVHVSGNLAAIWAPYDLYRSGEFSHCGIDLFELVRLDGHWRIVKVTYIVQREDCPRRPFE